MKTITNGRLIAQGPFQDSPSGMVFFEFSFWQEGLHREDAVIVSIATVMPAWQYEQMLNNDLGTEFLAMFLSHVTSDSVALLRERGIVCTDVILVDPQGHDTDTMQVDNDTDELPF
jgi:hypothetical protein